MGPIVAQTEWITLLQTFGLAVTILVFIALCGIWLARWLKPWVERFLERGIRFIDNLDRTVEKIDTNVADMSATLLGTTRVLGELERATATIAADVRAGAGLQEKLEKELRGQWAVFSEALTRSGIPGREFHYSAVEGHAELAADLDTGAILYVSRSACLLLGYDETELLGKPVEILVPEDKREKHVQYRREYAQNPTTRAMGARMELRARKKDSSTVHVQVGLSSKRVGDRWCALATILVLKE